MSESQMAQAQINTTIFHQVNGKNGEIRFRTKFGRQKVMVFRRHDETKYFYVDIYDNKSGRYMCIAMDELDFLCSIRSNLEFLKSSFPKVSMFH
jgi:hypothetical protein